MSVIFISMFCQHETLGILAATEVTWHRFHPKAGSLSINTSLHSLNNFEIGKLELCVDKLLSYGTFQQCFSCIAMLEKYLKGQKIFLYISQGYNWFSMV